MKKILIIGATGMLGKPVTHELVKAGFDVTILARIFRKRRRHSAVVRLSGVTCGTRLPWTQHVPERKLFTCPCMCPRTLCRMDGMQNGKVWGI